MLTFSDSEGAIGPPGDPVSVLYEMTHGYLLLDVFTHLSVFVFSVCSAGIVCSLFSYFLLFSWFDACFHRNTHLIIFFRSQYNDIKPIASVVGEQNLPLFSSLLRK